MEIYESKIDNPMVSLFRLVSDIKDCKVVLLPVGYEESERCRMEAEIALALDKIIYYESENNERP